MVLREDLHDSDFRTIKQHIKTCGHEIKPTLIFFFHLEREAKFYFGRTRPDHCLDLLFFLLALHSSFVLPGSGAYIPCAVRGVEESFLQAAL